MRKPHQKTRLFTFSPDVVVPLYINLMKLFRLRLGVKVILHLDGDIARQNGKEKAFLTRVLLCNFDSCFDTLSRFHESLSLTNFARVTDTYATDAGGGEQKKVCASDLPRDLT